MSHTVKVKGIIDGLIAKYEKTSWEKILPAIFRLKDFETAMYQLVSDHVAGHPFSPHLPNMFKSFDLADKESFKVVIVNGCAKGNIQQDDGLAFSGYDNPFNQALDNTQPSFSKALDYLPETEGVLLLNATITAPFENPQNHKQMWDPVAKMFIKGLCYHSVKKVFVFIGKDTEHLGQLVTKGHAKVFVPELNDAEAWASADIFNRINTTLEKLGVKAVNW